jgi:mRNA-degrading endonuclease RelE of RelBE toxin-antitoxin system
MFTIEFSEDAERHLDSFSGPDQRMILAGIEEQLSHQPDIRTRNRKPMRANALGRWELRVQRFRVIYNIEMEKETVVITAIATKDGNKFLIDGKEYPL